MSYRQSYFSSEFLLTVLLGSSFESSEIYLFRIRYWKTATWQLTISCDNTNDTEGEIRQQILLKLCKK